MRGSGRVGRLLGGLAGAALAIALGPALAHGATICVAVSAPSCEQTAANVQAALDAAEATTAHDRVVVGAGIFDGPFLYAAGANGGGLDLVGQGPQTVLVESPNAPVNGVTVLDLRADSAGNPANVSDLAVHIPANATSGNPGNIGIDAGGSVRRVEVAGNAIDVGGNIPYGVRLSPGETLANSEIRMPAAPPGGTFAAGVGVSGGGTAQATITDTEITASTGIEVAGARALVSRSTIASRLLGIDVCAAIVVAEDSLFRVAGGRGIDVNTGRCGGQPESSLTARHLTIVGAGTATGTGIIVGANNQAPTENRSATITHTIIRNVAEALRATTQDPAASATATITVGTSIFEAARVTVSSLGGGAATVNQPEANFDADPTFSDPLLGDFSLAPGSPAIDANVSPPLAGGESATDLAGSPRITDGDGDGVAERDIGAFEAPGVTPPDTSAPDTTITKKPKKKVRTAKKRKRVSFSFVSNEAGSSFECSLDGAAFAACSSPFSRKLKRGKHAFEVRAIDPAGNRDASPAKGKVRIRKRIKR